MDDREQLVATTSSFQEQEEKDDTLAPIQSSAGGSGVVQAIAQHMANGGSDRQFITVAIAVQIILIILFAVGTNYQDAHITDEIDTARDDYALFQHVNVMMFIGFGYLMTFLRRYGYSALSLNMMLSALCIQWGMFMQGLVDILFTHEPHQLTVSIDGLAQGDIAAAVILISMGAVMFTLYTYIHPKIYTHKTRKIHAKLHHLYIFQI